MQATHGLARTLTAPAALGLETRVEFRKAAFDVLEALPEGSGRLLIDLAPTRHVDSAGLGALMLVQRRAAERRQVIVLRRPSDELRFLLHLTKLDDLFEFEAERAATR
jgi:anti-anti-sigma regulatory factor